MKELTIEQKAEAYDEAIEGIQEILSSGEDSIKMSRLQLRLQGIFPELKESEDERIRKELIRAFNSLNTIKVWNGIERTDILAWLEKQGNKDEEILVLKDQIESLHAAIKAIKETYRIELEKQCEQKPAWGEEDENRINRLIAYFEDKESFTAEDDIEYANWLKSLKDRYVWKPSDEQMKALDAFIEKACAYLDEKCRKFILTAKDIEDFKNYMKGE